ncbi:hydrogenase expression/formation protein HypE [Bacteroidota bacterium]
MSKAILLGHGSGGKMSHDLIKNLFMKYFNNPILQKETDSALIQINKEDIAFTTDSYVVDPIFFPGGNIGDLSICGTVNDLAVSGAKPLYISVSFIIEEGFGLNELEMIVRSMSDRAKEAGVLIVTGDTKVVNRGKCDKVFINTSGIGILETKYLLISTGDKIEIGDQIIINGTIADHGMAIMGAREGTNFESDIQSDSAPLNHLIQEVLKQSDKVKFMRDVTRGGLATVLTEIAKGKEFGIDIIENKIPLNENVNGMCELLGFDPMFVANEGKVLLIVNKEEADNILTVIKNNKYGIQAQIIGEIVEEHKGKAILKTQIGGSRIIDMLAGEQLPRIC